MRYYANGRIQDLPQTSNFVRWDTWYTELALKVARREMVRLRGWEAAPGWDQYVQTLVGAVANDACGLFCVRPAEQDQDWPRFACFASWAFQLDQFSFDRLVNDIRSGHCHWCEAVVGVLDQQCCSGYGCTMDTIATDPCLQGTGPAADIVFVSGTPHNFALCGKAHELPASDFQLDSLLAWLGVDANGAKNISDLPRSPSGQPLPPVFETVSYGEEAGEVPWTWLAAAGAAIGLSLLVFWSDE